MGEFDYSLLKSCGDDVYISDKVEIKRPHLVEIGNHVAIDSGFYCTTALKLNDYIHIGPAVTVIGGESGILKIGNFCTISAGARITCLSDSFKGLGLVSTIIPPQYRDLVYGCMVGMDDFSSICTNATILPNVYLARGVVVGACSLVTKFINEPWTIWVGCPVRKLKNRPKEKMLQFAKKLGYNYDE